MLACVSNRTAVTPPSDSRAVRKDSLTGSVLRATSFTPALHSCLPWDLRRLLPLRSGTRALCCEPASGTKLLCGPDAITGQSEVAFPGRPERVCVAVVVNLETGRDKQPDALEHLTQLVRDDLDRVNELILQHMQSPVALIPQLAGHIIAAGGKRLRPVLTLAAARLCGYEGERHLGLAACVEF